MINLLHISILDIAVLLMHYNKSKVHQSIASTRRQNGSASKKAADAGKVQEIICALRRSGKRKKFYFILIF
jgi:hypothetical protein